MTKTGITAITIENFKGISSKVRIPLRNITVLFGANSAGKSTILQAIHYARELMLHNNPSPDKTSLGGDVISLGNFRDIVHKHDISRTITIGFEIVLDGDGISSYSNKYASEDQRSEEYHNYLNDRMDIETITIEMSVEMVSGNAKLVDYSVALNNNLVGRISMAQDNPFISELNFEHELFACENSNNKLGIDNDLFELIVPLLQEDDSDESGDVSYKAIPIYQESVVPEFSELLPLNNLQPYRDKTDISEDELKASTSVEDVQGKLTNLEFLTNQNILLSQIFVRTGEELAQYLKETRYIGPLRAIPARNFSPSKTVNESSWANGMAAWEYLLSNDKYLLEDVNRYLENLGVQYRVTPKSFTSIELTTSNEAEQTRKIQEKAMELMDAFEDQVAEEINSTDSKEEQVSKISGFVQDNLEILKESFFSVLHSLPTKNELKLYDIVNDIEVTPSDIGVGISQLIPVVVAMCKRKGNSILTVEQPELHLHPSVTANIGDILIKEFAKVNTERICLIETHSEHMMLRLLRRIRETSKSELQDNSLKITPSDVSVIFVEKSSDSLSFIPVETNTDGDFKTPFPNGFFEERIEELF